jgi:hypothetical protein
MGETRKAYKIAIRKLEGKRLLGRPGLKGDDENATGFREIVSEDVAWIQLARMALVDMVGTLHVK